MKTADALRYPPAISRDRAYSFNWFYARHHARRFEWIRDKIASTGKKSVSILELGCHDVRSLTYVPVNVHRYVGLDAGWQSGWNGETPYGLEAGRIRLQDMEHFEVRRSSSPEDIEKLGEQFDIVLVLETFEYLEPSALEAYVAALAGRVRDNGCILATMPNEKGIPLLVKALGAKLAGIRRSEYTARQFFHALLGRMDQVPRASRGRKGFDYSHIANLLARYFPSLSLEGVGLMKLPPPLSTNIGMVASKERPRVAKELLTTR
ncbi:MAG TPA: hypothetical protein VFI45_19110 [Candidatus Acidoferrum sp.]|nr:hypothetical protein [Candidatus Acidoferrum sp.]